MAREWSRRSIEEIARKIGKGLGGGQPSRITSEAATFGSTNCLFYSPNSFIAATSTPVRRNVIKLPIVPSNIPSSISNDYLMVGTLTYNLRIEDGNTNTPSGLNINPNHDFDFFFPHNYDPWEVVIGRAASYVDPETLDDNFTYALNDYDFNIAFLPVRYSVIPSAISDYDKLTNMSTAFDYTYLYALVFYGDDVITVLNQVAATDKDIILTIREKVS